MAIGDKSQLCPIVGIGKAQWVIGYAQNGPISYGLGVIAKKHYF